MSAPASPLVRLNLSLRVLRERFGLPFEQAWPSALRSSDVAGSGWAEIAEATRDGWRRAYEGEPATEAEIALRAAMPRGWEHRDGLDRQCAWCAGPIGPERDRRAVYCGNRCRRAAHYHAHERTGAGGSADVRSIEGDGWETRRPMEAHRHVQS